MGHILILGASLMEWEEKTNKVKVDSGHRIAIPAEFREAMGAKPGDLVLVTIEEPGTLRVRTFDALIRQTQAWARQYVPEGVSVVDELIAERRAEAAREDLESSGS